MAQPLLQHRGCRNTRNERFKRYRDGDVMIGLGCDECLSEWMLPDYLPPGNPTTETILIGRSSFHLIEKERVDDETFSAHPLTTRIDNIRNIAEYLTPGDHIKYPWYLNFDHHAIVESVEMNPYGPDKVTLIHWQGGRGDSKISAKASATVVRERVDDISLKTSVVYRCDYDEGNIRADSKVIAVARAKAWLGETGYNLLNKNCEHFAIFCKIGRHCSFQQERLIKRFMSFCKEVSGQISGQSIVTELTGNVIEVGVGSQFSVDALLPSMQLIGLGLTAVVQSVALCLDLTKLYGSRQNEEIGEQEFVGRFWHSVCQRLEKVFFTGVGAAGVVVAVGALLPAVPITTGLAMTTGVFVAGALSTPWGYHGELSAGCAVVAAIVRSVIQHRDVSLDSIREISAGDHLVLPKWFLHPRCHAIVMSVDVGRGEFRIIRFTYQRGVITERITFSKPLYKVLSDDPYEPEEVIRRANNNNYVGSDYHILSFNCKHFAFWCKTGRIPTEP